MAAAAEHGRERRGVELRDPAARHREDPAVHLDEQGEAGRVGHVDELVGQVRDPLDVLRRSRGRDEHLDARHLVRLDRVEQGREQLALGLPQRRVQEAREHLLLRAVAQAPAERLGIALRRGRVRERPRVLVDPEREDCRLERADRHLALGEHADKRRRQGAVL